MKHNNVIPNGHFKKKWQFYVKTWFNQPARKHRRRLGVLSMLAVPEAAFLNLYSIDGLHRVCCSVYTNQTLQHEALVDVLSTHVVHRSVSPQHQPPLY